MQKLNLFINHYKCVDPKRQKELDFCFKTNKESGLFNEIINFSDRPTFNDFFNATKEYPEDINVFSNSDMYFNETINLVRGMGKKDCYALTRWELDEGEIVSFDDKHTYNKEAKAKHSQDVWVFNGEVSRVTGRWHIGVPGIDNRMAHEITIAGYKVSNPSNIIKCIHKHENEARDYNIPEGYNNRVPPPYKWVEVGDQVDKLTRRRKNV